MRDLSAETFRQHLLEKYSLPPKARARVENPANSTLTRPLRELWEATDLSAAEFADEVSDYLGVGPAEPAATARRHALPRRIFAPLPARVHDLPVSARRTEAIGSRSPIPRIPRPFAPPRSCSARRSRSRWPRSRTSRRCSTSASSADGADADEGAKASTRSNPTTISRACAISPAARRWCARSTICSSARSSCAPATSTSSRSAPASWCACASTACCARCRRPRACRRRR